MYPCAYERAFKPQIRRSCVRQNAGFCGVRPHSGECSYGFETASNPSRQLTITRPRDVRLSAADRLTLSISKRIAQSFPRCRNAGLCGIRKFLDTLTRPGADGSTPVHTRRHPSNRRGNFAAQASAAHPISGNRPVLVALSPKDLPDALPGPRRGRS